MPKNNPRDLRGSFCSECGQVLQRNPNGRPRLTCSEACAKARKNRTQRERRNRDYAKWRMHPGLRHSELDLINGDIDPDDIVVGVVPLVLIDRPVSAEGEPVHWRDLFTSEDMAQFQQWRREVRSRACDDARQSAAPPVSDVTR